MQFFPGQHCGEHRDSQQGARWAVAGQGPRGPGAEGQRLAARGQGSSAGVWQVGVNRAGVVWRRKDRALRDWNMEQNVTEGTQGKNVVAERKEVMGDR